MTNSTISNSKAKLPDHIYIYDVANHETIKPLLLNQIEEMIRVNSIKPNNEGYLYDYNIPETPRTYADLYEQVVQPYAMDIGEEYGLKLNDSKKPKPWFQQYTQNTAFGWHEHGGHWACVYYVELPEMSEATEFLNYDIPLKEGQIIFFPTFLVHRSPIIKSNTRKTIIATNVNFKVDREMIKTYGEESFKY
jgi:hypothetical protein